MVVMIHYILMVSKFSFTNTYAPQPVDQLDEHENTTNINGRKITKKSKTQEKIKTVQHISVK